MTEQNAQLLEDNARLRKETGQLRRENAVLVQRVSELERHLGLNSSNSGKPPSSDGLAKPPAKKKRTKSLRGKSDRKSGGQPGHPGKTLKQVATPDEVLNHFPNHCRACQAALSPEDAKRFAIRQVFGFTPPPPLFVTARTPANAEIAAHRPAPIFPQG